MAISTDGGSTGLKRHKDTSAADTSLTLTTPAPLRGKTKKLLWVAVKYSAPPTHSGVTIGINSGAGAAFDFNLVTGNANDEDFFWESDGGEFKLLNDDAVEVVAPAGGGSLTATIMVMMQEAE